MSVVLLPGTIHHIPDDMQVVLSCNPDVVQKRNSLTSLSRNERICRVTIVKKEETRIKHLDRMVQDLNTGKKRPCCRPGCPHHRESAMKWFTKMDH